MSEISVRIMEWVQRHPLATLFVGAVLMHVGLPAMGAFLIAVGVAVMFR